MRVSTGVIGLGVLVFVVPLPGTFVAGAILFVAGLIARLLGV